MTELARREGGREGGKEGRSGGTLTIQNVVPWYSDVSQVGIQWPCGGRGGRGLPAEKYRWVMHKNGVTPDPTMRPWKQSKVTKIRGFYIQNSALVFQLFWTTS